MQVKVDQQVQQAYDNQYSESTREWRELGARTKAKNIAEITHGLNPVKVLEVGAGDGSILKYLDEQKFAPQLYALEISNSGIQMIQQRDIKALKEAKQFDGYTIPYPDQFFDLVILSHVLEHVEFERLLLREIKRVSKYQVIEVPRDFRFGIDKKVKHFMDYGHINIYTPSSFQFLLRSEGFEIQKIRLKTYDADVFRFMGKKSWKAAILQSLSYVYKNLLMRLPFHTMKELYCSTITVLVHGTDKNLQIFDKKP